MTVFLQIFKALSDRGDTGLTFLKKEAEPREGDGGNVSRRQVSAPRR